MYNNSPTAADYAAHAAEMVKRENESLGERVTKLEKQVEELQKLVTKQLNTRK